VVSLFALLDVELVQVELELLALKDVAVAAARLTGARGNAGVEATSDELLVNGGVNDLARDALSDLGLDVAALLGGGLTGSGGGNLVLTKQR